MVKIPWREETKYEEQKFYDDLFQDYKMDESGAIIHKHDALMIALVMSGVFIFVWTGIKFHNFPLSLLSSTMLPVVAHLVMRDMANKRAQNPRYYEICFTPIGTIYILEHELIAPPIPLLGLSEDDQEELRRITDKAAETGEPQDYSLVLEKIIGKPLLEKVKNVEEKGRGSGKERKWWNPFSWFN